MNLKAIENMRMDGIVCGFFYRYEFQKSTKFISMPCNVHEKCNQFWTKSVTINELEKCILNKQKIKYCPIFYK